MINKEMMQKAADYIRKNCKADDWTFKIGSVDSTRTRFAQNGITQHISGEKNNISIQVAFGAQTGGASVNNTEEAGLEYLIKTAETIAQRNQPDPEYMESEAAHKLAESNNFSEDTHNLTPADLVGVVEKCVANGVKKGAKVSGMTEKDSARSAMYTKNGFEGYYDYSEFAHSMTMKKGGVETKVNRSMLDYKDFDINKIIDQLNIQFDSLSDPGPMAPEKLPVIMRPSAVADWFMYLFWMLNKRAADDGVTPFTDQLGKKFFGENFSMISTLDEPGLMAPPFTSEGLPTKNIEWVKDGVLKNMSCSRYYAKKTGSEANSPYNVLIEGGDATEEEMMKMVPRGVILNKLWYIRDIDRKAGTQTGLTRDGVLYFEDGKIIKSVHNFRWNDILHDVTRRIIAKGPSQLIETWSKVPTLLIDGFNFVDTTTF